MQFVIRVRSSLAMGLLLASAANAFARGPTEFQYQAGDRIDPSRIYAVWNPRDRGPLFAPGMKVMFFGVAQGCEGGGHDGRTAHPDPARWEARARALTGVAPGPAALRWTPTGDTPGCDEAMHGRTADAFVELNPEQGIALYTEAGPPQPGSSGFFGVFGSSGQDGKGVNRGIEGTFAGFRFDVRGERAIHPFDTGAQDPAIRIQSRLGVAAFRAQGHQGNQPIQADQHVAVTLLNEACAATQGQGHRLCQFKYLFHTALYRDGVGDWASVPWFRDANLLNDAGQGGLPVIQGPVGPSGQVTMDREFKLPMYRSMGASTQHQVYGSADFDLQVTFSQLRNALRMIVAHNTRTGVDQLSDDAVSAVFGERWRDPSTWVLVDMIAGQEISNKTPDQQAFLGGSVKRLAVTTDASSR